MRRGNKGRAIYWLSGSFKKFSVKTYIINIYLHSYIYINRLFQILNFPKLKSSIDST